MKISAKRRARWLAYIAALRKNLPAAYPVKVRTCAIHEDLSGFVELRGRGGSTHFQIFVASSTSWTARIDTLTHEWAHCLDWAHRHRDENVEDHDESWGVWYSKAYRVIQDESDRLRASENK